MRHWRVVLLVLLGSILGGFGCVVFQVIAVGAVTSWAGVVATCAVVAAATCWAEWRSLLQLWRDQDD